MDTKGPIDEMKLCGESAMYGLHLQMILYECGCIGDAIGAELEQDCNYGDMIDRGCIVYKSWR